MVIVHTHPHTPLIRAHTPPLTHVLAVHIRADSLRRRKHLEGRGGREVGEKGGGEEGGGGMRVR